MLAIVLTSYLMIVLDISIVITGLPKIRESLAFSPAGLSWVQNAYTLAFGGLLMLGARAGDVLGRRRMFVAGLSLFTLASLVIGLAPTAGTLLAARAVQGVGAAVLAPSTLALLSITFPEGPERNRALSLYAAVAGVSASLGLVLGGLFAGALSWRVGFFINVPIGVALVLIARRNLPETTPHPGRFDLIGATTSTLGMTALVFGVVRAAEDGWGDAGVIAAISAGLALLVGFVINERVAAQPILPMRLFASRPRNGANAARVLFLGGMVGFWFFTTQFLQLVLGFTPFQAGLAFLPTTLPNFAAALMTPRLTQRFGNPAVLAGGLTVAVIGMAWLSRATPQSSYWLGIALPMVLIGIGQGGVLGPLTVAGVAGVEPRDAGAASGLVNVAHQLGGSLGLAVLVAIFASVHSPDLGHRIGVAFTTAAILLAGALAVTLALVVRPPHLSAKTAA